MEDYDGQSEEDLIRLASKGDLKAYAPLVSRYQNRMFTLIFRSLQDFQSSEDLCQEVFIKAYKALPAFRFEAKFSTWLTRIALRQLSSFRSSRAYSQRSRTELTDYSSFSSDSASMEQELARKDEIAALQSCFAKLTEKLKQVVLLVGYSEHSYEEAAQILQVPLGTVSSRLHPARLTLLACMGRVQEGVR